MEIAFQTLMKASMQRERKTNRRTGEKLSHLEKQEARREKDRERKREKARKKCTTASRQSSPVGSLFFNLISTLLIRSVSGAAASPHGREERALGASSHSRS